MPSSNNPTVPDGPDSTAQRDLETHPSGSAVPVAPTAAGPALPNPPSIRLYLHSPDHEIEIIEVTGTARVRDVITVEEDLIFLDGNDEPVDIDLTLIEIVTDSGQHHHHVHKHPCRRITVEVTYGGLTKTLEAAPSSPIESLRLRAVHDFGIDPVTGATLVLRLPGTDADLPGNGYLTELVLRRHCSLALNLLPSGREAG